MGLSTGASLVIGSRIGVSAYCEAVGLGDGAPVRGCFWRKGSSLLASGSGVDVAMNHGSPPPLPVIVR